MYVVLRKFEEAKEWNICAVASTKAGAEVEVEKEIRGGREARFYQANRVYIAENGNHSWN